MEIRLKEIRKYANKKEFYKRLEEWQRKNNCSGVPHAYELGLIRVGYSVGTYGINGTLYIDVDSGCYIGVPERSYNIYVD